MPTIVTFTPLQAPRYLRVEGEGRMYGHSCEDSGGVQHRQRLPLGSVRGIMYVDALCLHCGAHLIWIEDDKKVEADSAAPANESQE